MPDVRYVAQQVLLLMTARLAIQPALLGEKDAAAFLGIKETKLRELGLPRRKLGRRRLYDRRDLEAYVDSLPYDDEEDHPDEGEEWLEKHGQG